MTSPLHLLLWALVSASGLVLAAGGAPGNAAPGNAFDFFRPHVALRTAERTKLDAGEAIVKTLPASDGEVAVFSAARIAIDGDRLVAWVRRIQDLKKGKYVPAIGRFSQPPRAADVAGLELEDRELEELGRCRSGDCGLKLNETEIATLRGLANRRSPDWKAVVQQAFRDALVARAQQYLAGGLSRSLPYVDGGTPIVLESECAALSAHSSFLQERVPRLTQFLGRYPAQPIEGTESFLYWSKEVLGGRPVVSITHVAITRYDDGLLPSARVVAKQVYASHYMTGSLAVTTIVGGRDGFPRYLAYLNRSRVDVLNGLFAGLVRRIMERRVREDAALVVDSLRQRLLSGEPPR